MGQFGGWCAGGSVSSAVSRFAIAAHEIRTPTVGMLGAADLLAQTLLTDQQRSLVATLQQTASWLLAILNEHLAFSSLESGEDKLHLEPTSARELLAHVSQQFRVVAESRGLDWMSTVGGDVQLRHYIDGRKVQQVLANFVSNAIKMTKSGSISVTCRSQKQGTLSFEVADTGPGINAEVASRIFQPFETGDGPLGSPSTGLGLSISRGLVSLMGGTIGVETELGAGAKFWFEIPVEIAQAAAAPSLSEPVPVAPSDILLVEDDPTSRLVVRQMLEHLGHRVVAVADGDAAVKEAGRRRYDLVLMDCELDEVDGREATRQIRATGNGVTVVALSADDTLAARTACEESGMDDYLAKPVRLDALRRAVSSYLRQSPGAHPSGS